MKMYRYEKTWSSKNDFIWIILPTVKHFFEPLSERIDFQMKWKEKVLNILYLLVVFSFKFVWYN